MVSRAAPQRGARESARKVWARNAVLEASPNAVVAVDRGGLIVYANPQVEKTFGYARSELLGQSIEILLPERVARNHVAVRTAFVAHPVARPMGIGLDLAGRRKDGTEFPVEISLSPVGTADDLQIVATIVDLAARKAVENQLHQTEKLESIGRLAGGIAHDFNNMLFAIRGYAELLEQDLGSDDPVRLEPERLLHSVKAISQAADRATALTAQLLAFSRQQMVTLKVLDVKAAVVAIEPMLRQLIGENMNLVIKLDPETGHIRADASQIDQIVVNLVVNARDAMPNGGTVTIESGNAAFEAPYAADHFDVKPGPYVFVAVSDNGVGMDRTTRDHIFEPFFTTKEVGKGTGLGLATTYGIVHQAGGHIWLYSEPGHGSAFKLYFPSVDAPIEKRPPVSAAPRAGVGTILVVEDEPTVRDMTTQLFERAGYDVLAVADSVEAMTTARIVDSIDVLVTDVVMPGMSGIELAEHMMDRYPRLGVVLLSGYTAETLDLERVMARGAAFVAKPVTSNELLETALRAVAARRAATASQ